MYIAASTTCSLQQAMMTTTTDIELALTGLSRAVALNHDATRTKRVIDQLGATLRILQHTVDCSLRRPSPPISNTNLDVLQDEVSLALSDPVANQFIQDHIEYLEAHIELLRQATSYLS